jgi:hypothetical protein
MLGSFGGGIGLLPEPSAPNGGGSDAVVLRKASGSARGARQLSKPSRGRKTAAAGGGGNASTPARAEAPARLLRRALEALLNALEKMGTCEAKLAKVKAPVYILKYEDELATLTKLKATATAQLQELQRGQDELLARVEHVRGQQQGGEEEEEEEAQHAGQEVRGAPGEREEERQLRAALIAPAGMELLSIVVMAMEQDPLQADVRVAVCSDIRRYVDKQRKQQRSLQRRQHAGAAIVPARGRAVAQGGAGGSGGAAFGSSEGGVCAAADVRRRQQERQAQPLHGLDVGGASSALLQPKGFSMAKAPPRDLQAFVSLPKRDGLAMASDFGSRRRHDVRVAVRAQASTFRPSESDLGGLQLGGSAIS